MVPLFVVLNHIWSLLLNDIFHAGKWLFPKDYTYLRDGNSALSKNVATFGQLTYALGIAFWYVAPDSQKEDLCISNLWGITTQTSLPSTIGSFVCMLWL